MTNETLQMSENPWNTKESAWVILFVSVIILTGILGNTLVIVVTLINCTLKTTANAFIVNLAVADILALFSFGIMVSSLARGKWIYGDTACKVNGFTIMTFGLASALSISAISINRYLVTANLTAYHSLFGAKNRTLFLLVALWIFAGTFGSLPLVGWSRYEYFPARGFCFWSYSTSFSYTITFYTLVAPCCLAAAFCYWKIYLTIRQNKQGHNQNLSLSSPKDSHKIKRRQEMSNELSERKITLSICVVVFVYYTTLAPFSIVNLMVVWKPSYEISPSVDIVTTIVAMMNHVINVFIYATLNRKYRQAIRNLFEKIKGFVWPNENRVQSFNRSRKQTPKHDVTWC
ncbi:melanopsin-like [Actinia tenebrosa]|uniref:Melanopsin-like n=1 Tax=Actinia tenebrosa TaxID=6105 RepID=A0A6P8HKB4_ACTTE|nr:melanopsin-like [Actinia tenebrosa]